MYFGSNSRERRAALTPTPHARFPSQVRVLGVLLYIMGFLYRMYRTKRVTNVQAALQRLLEHLGRCSSRYDVGRVSDMGAPRTPHTAQPHTALTPPSLLPPSTAHRGCCSPHPLPLGNARNEFASGIRTTRSSARCSLYSTPWYRRAGRIDRLRLKFFPRRRSRHARGDAFRGGRAGLLAMMIIILFSFDVAINIFGTQSENFYLFVKAIGTLFLILLGGSTSRVDTLWWSPATSPTSAFLPPPPSPPPPLSPLSSHPQGVLHRLCALHVLRRAQHLPRHPQQRVHRRPHHRRLRRARRSRSACREVRTPEGLWRERKTIKAVAKMKKVRRRRRRSSRRVKEKGLAGQDRPRSGRPRRRRPRPRPPRAAAAGASRGRRRCSVAEAARLARARAGRAVSGESGWK